MNTTTILLLFLSSCLILCFIVIYNRVNDNDNDNKHKTIEGFNPPNNELISLKQTVQDLQIIVNSFQSAVHNLQTKVKTLDKKLSDLYAYMKIDYNYI
jgi:hypothetical protein